MWPYRRGLGEFCQIPISQAGLGGLGSPEVWETLVSGDFLKGGGEGEEGSEDSCLAVQPTELCADALWGSRA